MPRFLVADPLLAVRVATREEIEGFGGGSDAGVLIFHKGERADSGELLGWADDYGTVRHPTRELPELVRDLAEAFVAAAMDLAAELMPSNGETGV